MRSFVVSLSLGCLTLLAQPVFGADKWLSVRTKNFLLVGNASDSDIRKVGRTLEEFRAAVSMVFPKMEQTSSVPTTIFVFKNEESFKPYKPLYKGQPSNVLGFSSRAMTSITLQSRRIWRRPISFYTSTFIFSCARTSAVCLCGSAKGWRSVTAPLS